MAEKAGKLINTYGILIAAMIVTVLVYLKVLGFGHISWDDPEMVFKNRDVSNFRLGSFFTSYYVGNYLPLTMMLHAVAWSLFGSMDAGHHLVNLLFHLANAFLVFSLSMRLFRQLD